MGLGGHAYIAKRSQDAYAQYRPYFAGSRLYGLTDSLEDFAQATPTSVGSPQEVIDKTLTFHDQFGDHPGTSSTSKSRSDIAAPCTTFLMFRLRVFHIANLGHRWRGRRLSRREPA